jgi:hypothetical protein
MAAVIGRGVQQSLGNGDHRCLQSPFVGYYIVVFSLNAVGLVGGVISQLDLHRGQSYWKNYSRCDSWLFTNALFAVLHILAAIYIVRKIEDPEDGIEISPLDYQLQQQQQQQNQSQSPKVAGGTKSGLWKGNKIHVEPLPQWKSDTPIVSPYANKSIGSPCSWVRVKHVLLENVLVAIYLAVYLVYLIWHFFVSMQPCNNGMKFAQRTADIFVLAAPCAFFFSVVTMLMERRNL